MPYLSPAQRLRQRVLRLSRGLEPQLRQAMFQAYDSIRATFTTKQITDLLQIGGAEALVSKLTSLDTLEKHFRPVRGALTQGTIDASKNYILDMPSSVLAAGVASQTFNVLNPLIVEGLKDLNTRVFREMADEIQETFRATVLEGIELGKHPSWTARRAREFLGLAPNQKDAIDNFERMLREGDRTVLGKKVGDRWPKGRKLRDHRWDRTLDKALGRKGTGLNEGQIQKMTAAYRRRMIAHNAETHARTAALDAHRAGQRLSWEDAIQKGAVDRDRLVKDWSTSGDSKVRELHVTAGANDIGIPFDDVFPTTGDLIPGESEWHCRCLAAYRQISKKEAADLGMVPRPKPPPPPRKPKPPRPVLPPKPRKKPKPKPPEKKEPPSVELARAQYAEAEARYEAFRIERNRYLDQLGRGEINDKEFDLMFKAMGGTGEHDRLAAAMKTAKRRMNKAIREGRAAVLATDVPPATPEELLTKLKAVQPTKEKPLRLRELENELAEVDTELKFAMKKVDDATKQGNSRDRGIWMGKANEWMDEKQAITREMRRYEEQVGSNINQKAFHTVLREANPNAGLQAKLTMSLESKTARSAPRVREGFAWWQNNVHRGYFKGHPVTIRTKMIPKRAQASGKTIEITFNSDTRTVVHELGHVLEHSPGNNKLLRAARKFWARRTKNDTFHRLDELLPGHGYGADEMTRPDKFFSPYCGKVYGIAHWRFTWDKLNHINATEIISMGLDRMWQNPLRFAQEDFDYFSFIWQVMRGDFI